MSARDPAPSDDLLAAELSFGLLDLDERRDAEARQRHDSAFARLCAIWNDRAAALIDGPDMTPSPGLWESISARLPANDHGEIASLRRAVRRWRGATLGLGVMAAALGGAAVHLHEGRSPPGPARIVSATPIVVILTSADRHAIVSVSFDPASGHYSVARDAFETGRHSAELWVIPADKIPRSLGLISGTGRTGQIAPREGASRIAPGVTLAISLEPLGGSKTGKPSGRVVLTGRV